MRWCSQIFSENIFANFLLSVRKEYTIEEIKKHMNKYGNTASLKLRIEYKIVILKEKQFGTKEY